MKSLLLVLSETALDEFLKPITLKLSIGMEGFRNTTRMKSSEFINSRQPVRDLTYATYPPCFIVF